MPDIKIGLIGGSGLGQAMAAQAEGNRYDIETPFGPPSAPIIETHWDGLPVFFLARHGLGHRYNPSQVPFRANIFALKRLGVTHVIASGAVGSLREQLRPRDLAIPDQIIDKTNKRANTMFEHAAVHVEFAEPFCPVLRHILIDAGEELVKEQPAQAQAEQGHEPEHAHRPFHVHRNACYVCMEGPAFSTRAESLMHRLWGGDLIGMTAMPEAKLAREAELSYALVALVTDYDCWRVPPTPQGTGQVQQPVAPKIDPAVLLKEILGNLHAATENGIKLIRRAVQRIAERPELQQDLQQAPALQALKLAIWSDKARLLKEHRHEVELLGPLWMKYFEE